MKARIALNSDPDGVVETPRSLRAAVNGFCRECIYDPTGGDGSWRQQVGACTSVRCPLYLVRPLPRVTNRSDKAPFSSVAARSQGEASPTTGQEGTARNYMEIAP
jgi:hypothetical protein